MSRRIAPEMEAMLAELAAKLKVVCVGCGVPNPSTLHVMDCKAAQEVLRTPVVLPTMPNKPKTPISNFRIPPELKAAAQAKARERGESLTDVVVKALERYVKRG